MGIRIRYSSILTCLMIALIVCSVKALRSEKKLGRVVGLFDLSLILPILGNLIIIGAHTEALAAIGYYFYYIGMDVVMMMLVLFTDQYCQGIGDGQRKPTAMYYVVLVNIIHIVTNLFTDHAFELERIMYEGQVYYRSIAHVGLYLHRGVDYFLFACVVCIFFLAIRATPRIYREKFSVMLIAMLITGSFQTVYVFSRIPVDRSMIGYGMFGILLFYFALYYRPFKLLDRLVTSVASRTMDAIYLFDFAGNCVWVNTNGYALLDVEHGQSDKIKDALIAMFGDITGKGEAWTENIVLTRNGKDAYYVLEKNSVWINDTQFDGSFLVIRDDTEHRRLIEEERYNSTHDILTGLFNKQHLYFSIRESLVKHADIDYNIVLIDVKNFKIVNDVFGNEFGDTALVQISDRIKETISENGIAGRLVGDTFGVLIPVSEFDAEQFEQNLATFIVSSGTRSHQLLIHAGVYHVIDRGIDVSVMFDRARLALSGITDEYKTHVAYYNDNIRNKVLWEQKITIDLHAAISQNQIHAYLQPITNTDGKIVGAEALARWVHSEQGFLSPGMFIPVFERNGMIVEVDRHIWKCACEILNHWKGVHDDLFVSINISPKDFYFIDVMSEIKSLVTQYDVDPGKLRIEITETAMMSDSEERMRILAEFRSEGFIVEMDDFGSGYSSLNLLKDMPVDVLKIDMNFLASSSDNSRTNTIIKNVINLSKDLDMTALTEGVETKQQYQQLIDMGCNLFQGYYFAKPMPVNEFEKFVNSRNDTSC